MMNGQNQMFRALIVGVKNDGIINLNMHCRCYRHCLFWNNGNIDVRSVSINTRAMVEPFGVASRKTANHAQSPTHRALTALSPDPLCKYQEFTHGPSMDQGSSQVPH